MIELKLKLDDIDYSGIAELAMPIVKEKLSESGNFVGGLIGKHIPAAAMNAALSGFLQFLTPEQKDEIVLSLINKYEKNIIDILQQTALNNGVDLTIKGLNASKIDRDD